jgi:hypothetical protein
MKVVSAQPKEEADVRKNGLLEILQKGLLRLLYRHELHAVRVAYYQQKCWRMDERSPE